MQRDINLLVINPGSTSTKISIFENGKEVHRKDLEHSSEELSKYTKATDQADFRKAEVEAFLKEANYDLSKFSAIVARGGSLPPIHTGAYVVNDEMIDVLNNRPIGQHASSAAAIIAYGIAKQLGLTAYIYDGNTADEMDEIARLSGHPLVSRMSMGHILNTKAVARMYCEKHNKRYEEMNLIIVHLGGGISIGLHKRGRIVDILTDEEGTMSPERSGGLPSIGFAKVCFSGKYNFHEVSRMIRGGGGLAAYLGTNNARKVEDDAAAGDAQAIMMYQAMAYQTSKCIGSLATAVCGKLDGILLTGGLARSKMLTGQIEERVKFIAPVTIIPGEFEMEALAAGITRVLNGEETAREYKEYDEISMGYLKLQEMLRK